MLKKAWLTGLLVISALTAFTSGCGSSNTSTPTAPSPSGAPTPPAAGQVAKVGGDLFAKQCTFCHGKTGGGGQGPAIIGATASLDKYNTAQGLFDYVSANMPKSNPGSLSGQDHLNIVVFLLVENGYLQENTPFLESQLSNITLK